MDPRILILNQYLKNLELFDLAFVKMGLLKKVRSVWKSATQKFDTGSSSNSDRELRCPEARGTAFVNEFIEASLSRPTCWEIRQCFSYIMVEEEKRAQAGISGYICNHHTGKSTQDHTDADAYRYIMPEAIEDDAYSIVDDDADVPEAVNGAKGHAVQTQPEEVSRHHEQMHYAPTQGPFPTPDFPGTMLGGEEYDPDADDLVDTHFPWPSSPMTPPWAHASFTAGDDAPEYFNVISAVPPPGVEPVSSRAGSVTSASSAGSSSIGGESMGFSDPLPQHKRARRSSV